jgi:hypothetical protein
MSNPRTYTAGSTITWKAPGIFEVDCLLGGTYSIFAGYGPSYAMHGYISLENDNSTITCLTSYVAGWGDGLEGFQNGLYTPGVGLYWESIYAGGDIFAVTLN